MIHAYEFELFTYFEAMLCYLWRLIKGIGHIGVDDRCRVMFVGVVLISPHETITRPLGGPRGLKACVTC